MDLREGRADSPAAPDSAPGSAAFLGLLLEGVREYAIFALTGDGSIASWNAGAELMTGYQAHEALGRPFSQLGDPDPRQSLPQLLERAGAAGRISRHRWWRRRGGDLVWIDELITPLQQEGAPAGYLVVARDLTEQVRAEERLLAAGEREEQGLTREASLRAELQAAERRAAFLAEASSILVASAINFDSTVRSLARLAVSRLGDWCIVHGLEPGGQLKRLEVAHRDPRKEELLGRVADRMRNRVWLDSLRSVLRTAQAQVLDALPAALLERVSEEDREALLGDAASPSVALVTPLLGRGRVLGALTLVAVESGRRFDESDVELAEELGRRAAIALDNARLYREAQEANQAKADFLAVMSHELRTPLNAIMGYTDLLDAEVSGPLTERQRSQIGRVRTSARHLLQLIEEILAFARMETGGEDVRVEPASVAHVAAEAVGAIEPLAEAKGLELRLELNGEDETELTTDTTKLRQILVNLLSNAVKFTRSGWVVVRYRSHDGSAHFEVQDTGIGIPEEQHQQIFDPFWQVERPNTRHVGGTGLGLSVSRRYARMLGGDIEVESTPGQGATFRVHVPMRQASAPPAS